MEAGRRTPGQQHDVIIVGAGTAGASLAVALGRQGRKVLLIEKTMKQQVQPVLVCVVPVQQRVHTFNVPAGCTAAGSNCWRADATRWRASLGSHGPRRLRLHPGH